MGNRENDCDDDDDDGDGRTWDEKNQRICMKEVEEKKRVFKIHFFCDHFFQYFPLSTTICDKCMMLGRRHKKKKNI